MNQISRPFFLSNGLLYKIWNLNHFFKDWNKTVSRHKAWLMVFGYANKVWHFQVTKFLGQIKKHQKVFQLFAPCEEWSFEMQCKSRWFVKLLNGWFVQKIQQHSFVYFYFIALEQAFMSNWVPAGPTRPKCTFFVARTCHLNLLMIDKYCTYWTLFVGILIVFYLSQELLKNIMQ